MARSQRFTRPGGSLAAVVGISVLLFGPVLAPFTAIELSSASATENATGQRFTAESGGAVAIERDSWSATSVRSSASTAEVRASQDFAREQLVAAGLSDAEFSCLVQLWNRESRWNHRSENTSSGAFGIPQALPGTKMASAGADWETNPETQIRWGLSYIAGRYGTPCGAWAHSEAKGWY